MLCIYRYVQTHSTGTYANAVSTMLVEINVALFSVGVIIIPMRYRMLFSLELDILPN